MSVQQTLARTSLDWFDSVKQKLDVLRAECLEVQDRTSVPSDTRIEQAKFEIEKLMRLAKFPNMPDTEIWIGPDGELGITWAFSQANLEIVFSEIMLVRVFTQTKQVHLEHSLVPEVLAKLANPTPSAP